MKFVGPKAYIHIDRLIHNLRNIRYYIGDRPMMCVVKANGYGHGAIEIAKNLDLESGIILAVFSFEEAIELRKAGIKNEIFTFSKLRKEYLQLADELRITLNACSFSNIKFLSEYQKQNYSVPKFHLKFDTGMTRLGFDENICDEVFEYIMHHHLLPEGLYSHFSTADEGNLSYAEYQLDKFKTVLNKAPEYGIEFKYVHCSNSGAVLNLPDSYFNLIRIGMLLYGIAPSNEVPMNIKVKPVMSFCGPIVNLRRVKAGTQISYGGVYSTDKDTNIGVVQTGFADGLPRNWYKDGYVSYKGNHYKIVGRICMDQLMIDFNEENPKDGDEVLFFGKKDRDEIKVEDIAQKIGTTTYVLLTAIQGRTKRIIL